MNDIFKPKVNILEQPTIKCEKCENEYFTTVFKLKKVSKILTGEREDTVVPFTTYSCSKCNYINEEFNIF